MTAIHYQFQVNASELPTRRSGTNKLLAGAGALTGLALAVTWPASLVDGTIGVSGATVNDDGGVTFVEDEIGQDANDPTPAAGRGIAL